MQIIAINPSRQSQQQVWLKFDTGLVLPLKVDDIVTLKITKFSDISSEDFDKIISVSASFVLLEYALRQLAISPKTSTLLLQKLKNYCYKIKNKYPYPDSLLSSLSSSTVTKVDQLGLLDSQTYIDYVLRKYPKKSQMEISYILRQGGVDYHPTPDRELEVKKIKDLINKKYHSYNLADYKVKNKIFARLANKGFPIELIKTAIDEILAIR